VTPATDTSAPAAADKRAARRAAEREQMKAAIAALQTSEGWRRWLRARRYFHKYSLPNQLLIAHQCPDATRVAGFRAWLKLGYCVRMSDTHAHVSRVIHWPYVQGQHQRPAQPRR
jgi:hypothetical protein